METPHKIYKRLSHSSRINFWTVTTNFIVAVITVFIGVTYQLFIIDQNEHEQEQLIHTKLIQELGPLFDAYEESNYVFKETKNLFSSQVDVSTKNEDFLIYSDSLFNVIFRLNDAIRHHSTIFLLSKYGSSDSILQATNNILEINRVYNFLLRTKRLDLSKDDFERGIRRLSDRPLEIDSIYEKITNAKLFDKEKYEIKPTLDSIGAGGILPKYDRIDLVIKELVTTQLLIEINKIHGIIGDAQHKLLLFDWEKKHPWTRISFYFAITLIVAFALWLTVINLTFRTRHQPMLKDKGYVNLKNQQFEILDDFNSSDEYEEYIDDLVSIYTYQKQEIRKLRNQVNRLLFVQKESKTPT